jgi:hypothetical protein
MKACRRNGCIAPLVLKPWHEMEVSGYVHAMAALSQVPIEVYVFIGSWRQNSIKFSRADSRVKMLKLCNVLGIGKF